MKKNVVIISLSVLICIIIGLLGGLISLAITNNNLKKDFEDLKIQKEDIDNKYNDLKSEYDKITGKSETYDFYAVVGTIPTLYATLNAYKNKNPNTYMWFYRGNTISKEHSADFIHYFETQSDTNAESIYDAHIMRNKVMEILDKNPNAKFNVYVDDIRLGFILDIFVSVGVNFEDMQIIILSDGTHTYASYQKLNAELIKGHANKWNEYLQKSIADRDNKNFEPYDLWTNEFMEMSFYLSTLSNVSYWIQNPEYLSNNDAAVLAMRYEMNIVHKSPKAIYDNMDEQTRADYQKVVLANALVGNDELNTLEDAVNYFNDKFLNKEKEIVLILGSGNNSLNGNKGYIDNTIAFYTPTVDSAINTIVHFKGKDYTIAAGADSVTVDGKNYKIGEIAVNLYFKGHPQYPASEELQEYFAENEILNLPARTPVEVLFWMFDVKVGGYQSTSFLSCYAGQVEFVYGAFTDAALLAMKDLGFFDNTAIL